MLELAAAPEAKQVCRGHLEIGILQYAFVTYWVQSDHQRQNTLVGSTCLVWWSARVQCYPAQASHCYKESVTITLSMLLVPVHLPASRGWIYEEPQAAEKRGRQ
jgi:hypothetical protein